MSGRSRFLSYAASALAVVVALAFANRAEAASCGSYVTYKGQHLHGQMVHGQMAHGQMAHDMPSHSSEGPAEQKPCNGPNCSKAPASFPPLAPTTKITLEKQPAHYASGDVAIDGFRVADLCGSSLLITRYSPADIFRPPCTL